MIIAITYGIISIVWYAIINKDPEKIEEKNFNRIKKYESDTKKVQYLEKAWAPYNSGSELYKKKNVSDTLQNYIDAIEILKKNSNYF